MISIAALLLFTGLYLGLLIVMLFLAITAKTTGGRVASIIAGVALLFVIPLVMFVGIFSLRAVPMQTATLESVSPSRAGAFELHDEEALPLLAAPQVPPDPTSAVAAPAAPAPVNVETAAGTWAETASQPLKAEVYPSYSAAIATQLSSLRETLIAESVLQRDDQDKIIEPDSIMVSGFGSEVTPLVSQCRDLLVKQFPGVEVRSKSSGWPDSAKNQLSIHLGLANLVRAVASWDLSGEQQIDQCSLTLELAFNDYQSSSQSFVTEKPWVESFDRFVSMYPKRRFIVGYSSGLHSSESQARSAALADAARQAAIAVNGNAYSIIDERHVVDRFAQRLSRDYGEVWREAVLIEVPDANQINAATATVAGQFHRSAMGRTYQQIGIAVLVIVTILICTLLNWITQGYYRGRVLLGLAGVVAIGFFLAIVFVS